MKRYHYSHDYQPVRNIVNLDVIYLGDHRHFSTDTLAGAPPSLAPHNEDQAATHLRRHQPRQTQVEIISYRILADHGW